MTSVQLRLAFDMVAAVENALEQLGDLEIDNATYSISDYNCQQDGDIVNVTVVVDKTAGKFVGKEDIITAIFEELGNIEAEPRVLPD